MPDPTTAAATTPAAAPAPAAGTPAATPSIPAGTPAATTPASAQATSTPAPATTALTAGDTQTSPAAATVPEKYEFALEGGIPLDALAVDHFTPVFKEAGLSNEAANKLANSYIAYEQSRIAAQSIKWLEDAKSDKEVGGTLFDQNAKAAQQAFAKFGSPALKQLMDATGLGNHPEVLRVFVKLGKAMSEDKHVSVTTPAAAAPQGMEGWAKQMFPDMK